MSQLFIKENISLTKAASSSTILKDMGGSQAPVEVEDSISRIIDLLKRLKADDAGTFFNYQGQQLPW